MSSRETAGLSGGRRLPRRFLRRLAHWAAAIAADCCDAQHRFAVLRGSAGRSLPYPGKPPDNYKEFSVPDLGPASPGACLSCARGRTVR